MSQEDVAQKQMFEQYMKEAASRKPVNINEIIFKYTGKLRAPKASGLTIGRDIIPPMNTIPLNLSAESKRKFKSERTKLPDNFSWHNPQDVKTHKPGIPEDFITKPLNQGLCGSCWAFAVATVLSDRWAIANKTNSPMLSPTYLLSCNDKKDIVPTINNQKCDGGAPSIAIEFAHRQGMTNLNCQSYAWCLDSAKCGGKSSGAGNAELNRLVPTCGNTCLDFEKKDGGVVETKASQNPFEVLKVDAWPKDEIGTSVFNKISMPSSKTFIGSDAKQIIADIKQELWARGPVVSTFQIWEDFFLINSWYQGESGLIYMRDYNRRYESNGYHAVSIVGWGTDKDKDGKPLGYWIVRNSWGTAPDIVGHTDGFFKVAFSDFENKINTDTGFDVVLGLKKEEKALCGVIAPYIEPKVVEEVKPVKEEVKPVEEEVKPVEEEVRPVEESQPKNKWWLWVLIVLIVAFIIYFVMKK